MSLDLSAGWLLDLCWRLACLLDGLLRPTSWLCLYLLLSGWSWDLADCFVSFRAADGPCCGGPQSPAPVLLQHPLDDG